MLGNIDQEVITFKKILKITANPQRNKNMFPKRLINELFNIKSGNKSNSFRYRQIKKEIVGSYH